MTKEKYKRIYIETYGCQMNVNDSEIVSSILLDADFFIEKKIENADIIFLNTCSVRENAERKIFERLMHLKQYKKKKPRLKVGLLGCMAENLKEMLLEKNEILDLVVGPDEYRKLPDLLHQSFNQSRRHVAVELSTEETYDDIIPYRENSVSAFVSIMRGCDNFCSYCIVPYTRGRERSRNSDSIIKEVVSLNEKGVKEITLLGQNVNSYICPSTKMTFAKLLENCSEINPGIWFRFITSHPKDMSEELIDVISQHQNICKHIHLPLQAGSNRILKLMNRKYTREHYLSLIEKIRTKNPECAITTDIIAGFPSETIDEHKQTLSTIESIRFDGAFMFKYSVRPGTKAENYEDDISEKEKIRRLNEIIELQSAIAKEINKKEIGKIHIALVEGKSKRNPKQWQARSDTNKLIIFDLPEVKIEIASFVKLKITKSTSATLFGEFVEIYN